MRRLLVASRPLNWINTALPFLAVAISTGRGFSWAVLLGTVYFLVPFNLLMYGVNDLFDYESDRRNPRKGGVEGGLLPPQWAPRLWLAIAVTNLPFLVTLGWLGGPTAEAALLVTAASAVVYSAPPLRTKVIPALDAVTSSLHFTLPAVCGGLVAGAGPGALPWRFLIALFCWGIASQALGSIQDVNYDRAAGLRSIGTWLGQRGTALLCTLAYATATAIVASAGGPALIAAAALLPYVALAASCLGGQPAQARRAWRGFLGLNLLCGFVITQVLLHVWGLGSRDVPLLVAGGTGFLAWGAFWLGLVNLLATRPPPTLRTPLRDLSADGPEMPGRVGGGTVVFPGAGAGSTLGRAMEGVRALFDIVFQPHLLQGPTRGRLVAWSRGPDAILLDQQGPPRAVDASRLLRRPCAPPRAAWTRWRRDYAGRCGHALGVELAYALGVAVILLGPPVCALLALAVRDPAALVVALAGCVPVVLLRVLLAAVRRERPAALLLHPAAVILVLAAQLCSVGDSLAGRDLGQPGPHALGPAGQPVT